ncbi:hypothetical protein [Abyssalbus ytuae]|uniref:Secreted protein n=1 Tax=Abyssalbus ytuae TaxID=2926907 RepID=A0A9E7A0R5_9FLAO|nr:hypothetical protein [Abyssalbus ytuae]UOB17601.1 hypothetical protein MQE35_17910 [Abyssalbus ytuae]
MKRQSFTLLFLFMFTCIHAQVDTSLPSNGNNSLTVPYENNSSNSDSGISVNSNNSSEGLVDLNKKDFNFQIEQFANPGEEYEKKLNKKHYLGQDKKMEPEFRSDQYLGDFRSNSEFVKIICRDHEYPDGDRVRVYVNDVVIQPNILLDENFRGFSITLEKGFNKIDFEALNQGSSGPNTAEFRVYDNKGKVVSANQWNLATGVKATIIVVKE